MGHRRPAGGELRGAAFGLRGEAARGRAREKGQGRRGERLTARHTEAGERLRSSRSAPGKKGVAGDRS